MVCGGGGRGKGGCHRDKPIPAGDIGRRGSQLFILGEGPVSSVQVRVLCVCVGWGGGVTESDKD